MEIMKVVTCTVVYTASKANNLVFARDYVLTPSQSNKTKLDWKLVLLN